MDICIARRLIMINKDFLLALQKVIPSASELEKYGLDPDEIKGVQSTFQYITRNMLKTSSDYKSELEKMILENDCSTIEIGLIRFLDKPYEHAYGKQVAFCESDPIIVQFDGTVAMYDHSVSDNMLACAINSEKFLDALHSFIMIRHEKAKWRGRGAEAAQVCANLAGGNKYLDFFRLLCGFLNVR
jgi:hypothetical protein